MDHFQKIEVQIINAFVDHNKGGNPAGVVLNADHLTKDQKLQVAAKVGLSETAFVSKSDTAAFKLDFYTPTRQIAHCGHATIATFSYLSQLGFIDGTLSSKETIDGTRAIALQGELAFMEQKPPLYLSIENQQEQILKSLGLTKEALVQDAPIALVNTGNSFVIVPVKSAKLLKDITPDYTLISQISDTLDAIGYYVFCTETSDPTRDATTRMFAPRYGIDEEAGTGMAAGPLACYLHELFGLKKEHFLVEQGWFMSPPSPSLIIVDLTVEHGKIVKIMAGGKGISMQSKTVAL